MPVCKAMLDLGPSLSVRRAWIEISKFSLTFPLLLQVALREESVD